MNIIKKIIITSIKLFIFIIICLGLFAIVYYSGIYIDLLYKCKNETIFVGNENEYLDIDLDNDWLSNNKKNTKTLLLKGNSFKIIENISNRVLFESDKKYKVKNFLYCDIDRDNKKEILLVLWKKGKFGKYKPFFAKDNKNIWSQHIFIYDFDGSSIKPIWCSSYISVTIKNISFDEEYKILNVVDKENGRFRFIWQTFGLDSVKASKFDYDKDGDKIIENFKINAFGDNLIHHQIYEYGIEQNNKSFDYLYENIKSELDGDLNVINQETMFVDENEGYSDFPNFGSPKEVGDAIIAAGFNLVLLANNHTLDRENKGVITTYNYYNDLNLKAENKLSNKKINFVGISNNKNVKIPYKIVKKGDKKIAIFNYTYNVNENKHINFEKELPYVNDLRDERKVRRDLDEGIRKSDLSIVFVHWGDEYQNEINDFQKKWSKIFLKSGVDIVIGTHPHVLQKYEVLKDSFGNEMLIYYSLGNFISFQKGVDRLIGGLAKIDIAFTNHGVKIVNYDLKKTITHKQGKFTTTYMLDDYNNELAMKHNDYNDIIKNKLLN